MKTQKLVVCGPIENRVAAVKLVLERHFEIIATTEPSSLFPILVDREQQIDAVVFDNRSEDVSEAGHSFRAYLPRVAKLIREADLGTRLFELVKDLAFASGSPVLPEDLTHQSYSSIDDLVAAIHESLHIPQTHAAASESPPCPADADKRDHFHSGPEGALFTGMTRNVETRSSELKRMLEDLLIAGSHDVAILLIGETGSGKTFLSKLIHEASPRRNEPFVHVACGALPRDLIESELFGHMKGSFTSAHADKEGKFIAAQRGTILLDEIDVLGPDQQVNLLRVIETGEFEPVGSNQTLTSQARLIFASNLDLEPMVEKGRFRPDLYYRLNMLKFEIPPLRRRKVDIIPLSKKFIQKFQHKHGIPVNRVDDSVLDALLSYPWPGNIRELEHVMQRAVIYCRDGVLTRDNLPPHILNGQVGPANDPSIRLGRMSDRFDDQSLGQQIALSEKDIIEQTLLKNDFSRTNTAKELGISRVTLYNKMKKYEMLKASN